MILDKKLKTLDSFDIPILVEAFEKANWPKPASIFETYLQEQLIDSRLMWVAHVSNKLAGYVTLKWHSQYEPFAIAKIPEIIDLNVLPPFRKRGIGSMLLDAAEKEAILKSDVVGLGVGLYGGPDGSYGAAQKLYVKRGYIPDGKGATYNYQKAVPLTRYSLDDYLLLWLTKKLR
jgi:GNAT superfamily N-acetyltransferase